MFTLAFRSLVWRRLMNRIHFVGTDQSHTPTCDTRRRPQKDASVAVLVTELVSKATTLILVSPHKTARRLFRSVMGWIQVKNTGTQLDPVLDLNIPIGMWVIPREHGEKISVPDAEGLL
jgi:hypothetical protein